MTVESATIIGDLVPANPASTDVMSEGDDHIRLLKQVLLNTWAQSTSHVVDAWPEQLNYLVGDRQTVQSNMHWHHIVIGNAHTCNAPVGWTCTSTSAGNYRLTMPWGIASVKAVHVVAQARANSATAYPAQCRVIPPASSTLNQIRVTAFNPYSGDGTQNFEQISVAVWGNNLWL